MHAGARPVICDLCREPATPALITDLLCPVKWLTASCHQGKFEAYAGLFRFHCANASWSLVHRGPAGATPGASSSNATDGGGDGGDVGAVGEDGGEGEGEGGGGPPRGPAPRHSHTAVQHSSRSGPGEIIVENGMFVLGGTLVKEAVSGEFWLFDLAASVGHARSQSGN